MQPEHRYLAAVGMSGQLQMHPGLLGERPGVRLVGEQDRRGAFRPAAEGGAQVAAARPRVVDATQPDPVAAALQRDAAVAQHLDARGGQLAIDGVGAGPEIVVPQDGVGPLRGRDRGDRLRRLPGERDRVVHDVARHHQQVGPQARGAPGDALQPLRGDVAARVQIGELDDPGPLPAGRQSRDGHLDALAPQGMGAEQRSVQRERERREREPDRHLWIGAEQPRDQCARAPEEEQQRVEDAAQPPGRPWRLQRGRQRAWQARLALPPQHLEGHGSIEEQEHARNGQRQPGHAASLQPADEIHRRQALRKQRQREQGQIEAYAAHPFPR